MTRRGWVPTPERVVTFAGVAAKVARVSSGIASPRLIGREPELARLASLSAAAAGGTFAVALVKGDAGIGKTRLVAEFADSAACRDALESASRSTASDSRNRPCSR